jgi:mono/diheme cytochrome c family protein
MARVSRSSRKPRKGAQRSGRRINLARWVAWGVAAVCVCAVLAVPVYRFFWHRGEVNQLQQGMALMPEAGCRACHGQANGLLRWRDDGAPLASMEAARDAILNGRERVGDLPAAMPAFGARLEGREWQSLLMASLALEAMVGVPGDPELAAGYDLALEQGCFGCHGILGCGGVANAGSLTGEVPGWYGGSFGARTAGEGGALGVLRDGARATGLPIPGVPGPLLAMPSFQGRVDSTEMQLLVRYVEWLRENPPVYR